MRLQNSVVAYFPVIACPLTRLEAVYTLLTQSAAMAYELRLDSGVVVLDQAVYCEVLEVMRVRPEELKTVVLRPNRGGSRLYLKRGPS